MSVTDLFKESTKLGFVLTQKSENEFKETFNSSSKDAIKRFLKTCIYNYKNDISLYFFSSLRPLPRALRIG